MDKAVNDATLKQAGTIYQYLIALRDCFDLNDNDTLQIETNGDVSIINNTGGLFQKEVKHHFADKSLSDRDIDFWKTLANWYTDYERVKNFSHFILSTTSKIPNNSPFSNWNTINKYEKLCRLKEIGTEDRKREDVFREQYNKIFGESYNESRLLSILDKFSIEAEKTSLPGISNEFAKYVGHIPPENRDNYIGALLGEILIKVKDPPHKWEVTRQIFERILQYQTSLYGTKGALPLPNEYGKTIVPEKEAKKLEQKQFVEAIREIEYESQISAAIADYWKADMTIMKYFQNNLIYLDSLDEYITDLADKMKYAKATSELDADGTNDTERIKISKKLYNSVMIWDAKDFGSIIRNQGFFQRGVIHNIVDETEFHWKVGGEKDEH